MEDVFKVDGLYHVYFHAVGNDKLFRNDENYRFFLEKYKNYLSPFVDTYAYTLMPNHVHLLVKIKETSDNNQISNCDKHISNHFGKLKISYTKSFNKTNERYGVLFTKFIKRKQVNNESYFKNIIHYIHNNPIHHGYTKTLNEWKYCSYASILSNKPSQIAKKQVVDIFDGVENFVELHSQCMPISEDFTLE